MSIANKKRIRKIGSSTGGSAVLPIAASVENSLDSGSTINAPSVKAVKDAIDENAINHTKITIANKVNLEYDAVKNALKITVDKE